VDTGADLLQVPNTAAVAAGLSLSAGTPISITTAGGKAYMTRFKGVTVEIEGISIVTDLLCHPNSASRPLLGRQALSALVEFGFDTISWLWR
jgi:predicted aspartyl protease